MIPKCITCGKDTAKILGEIATCMDQSCPDLHLYDCRDGSYCKIREKDLKHPELN